MDVAGSPTAYAGASGVQAGLGLRFQQGASTLLSTKFPTQTKTVPQQVERHPLLVVVLPGY